MELRGNFGKAEAIFEMGLNRLGHRKKLLQSPSFEPLMVSDCVPALGHSLLRLLEYLEYSTLSI